MTWNPSEDNRYFLSATGERFTFCKEDFDNLPANAKHFIRYLAESNYVETRKLQVKIDNLRKYTNELEKDLAETEVERCRLERSKAERLLQAFEHFVSNFAAKKQHKILLKAEGVPTTF